MNELSWLIYAADVAGTVNLLTALAMPAVAAATGWAALAYDDSDRNKWDELSSDHKRYPTLQSTPPEGDRPAVSFTYRKHVRGLIAALVSIVIVNVAVPSSSTLYAVAASEVGESVVQSETGAKAIRALNAWLDRQISGQKPA